MKTVAENYVQISLLNRFNVPSRVSGKPSPTPLVFMFLAVKLSFCYQMYEMNGSEVLEEFLMMAVV